MIARHKLNILVFSGVLLISGLLGAAFQSWTACFLSGISLVLASLLVGHIRLRQTKRSKTFKRRQ